MISYDPLKETLKQRNMKISDMREFLSSTTVSKISKNKNVEMSTIDKICLNLDIPVEKVIKFVK
ncbi:helix-turn-helix transcriptional regulator [Listeria monocytogenes]|jgi:DNA-binding Xre family transcriptional regulator|nr:helix-turn-helix transcriptional regulator [Listeria monocytogenes]